MPNVELVRAIFIYYNTTSFKWIVPLYFELSCTQTDRHIDTKTDTQTSRHTHIDKHEYSIVVVKNKNKMLLRG